LERELLLLILKSAEESFATIDLSIIDLFSGEVEFAKIGAAATFIKRPDKVEIIKSTSLPVGILSNVDMGLSKKKLEDGDLLIMVSDGVLDSRKDIVKKEEWILQALSDISTNNPQEIADYLIEKAKANFDGQEKDDMTVLTAKVLERVS
jgi:stage II sporulation protein E